MKTRGHLAALSLLLLTLTGCNDSPPPATSGTSQSQSGSYLSPTAKASRRAQKTIDVTAMNKALEKFYIQEGRFPTNLTELVWRDYLPIIPVLPEGMIWDYDTNSGTVMVIKEAVKE
jgi:hypothetical protein